MLSNHLGIYAAPLDPYYEARDDVYVYAGFENASEAWFDLSPGYSGSTYGINETVSSATAVSSQSFQGSGSQKLYIADDTSVAGGWFVRHLSGSGTRSNNVPKETNGYIGFWVKTAAAGCQISIAIDNTNNVTADRGDWKNLINDGQWHLYQWNLDNNNDWNGWVSGDGIIDTVDFTVDSIQIQCSLDAGAELYIDEVAHSSRKSLVYLFETLGDFEPDGDVDLEDFAAFAGNWLLNSGNGNWDPLYDLYYPYDNVIGLDDLAVLGSNWLK